MIKLIILQMFLIMSLAACRVGESNVKLAPLSAANGQAATESTANVPEGNELQSSVEQGALRIVEGNEPQGFAEQGTPKIVEENEPQDSEERGTPEIVEGNEPQGSAEQNTPEIVTVETTRSSTATSVPSPYPAPSGTEETTAIKIVPPEDPKQPGGYPPPSASELTLPVSGYRVVNEFAHDPNAYTQGLVVAGDGGEFIEGTGQWGQSSLRRVDLESGDIVQYVALPEQYFGEGLTLYEDQIFQLTWKSNIGFVYDSESFELLGEFHYQHEGWGITHDGQQLIISDGTSTIHFLDPQTLTETRQIQVTDPNGPIFLLNELEYVDGEILANIWFSDQIARISPETGEVIGWIDLTGLFDVGEEDGGQNVLNGIAYDDQAGRLFVTGKRWPSIFEIELVP